jgi:hypothetical protein
MAGESMFTGLTALNLVSNREIIKLAEPLKVVANYKPPKAIEDYQIKFDPVKVPPIVAFKSVVVSQDPAGGQVVPAGTEIKVTLVPKGSLPVGSFQVSDAIKGKYAAADVEVILNDLNEKGQAVKPILDSEKAFEALSASEKSAIGQYATSIGLQLGSEADTKSAYEDIQFFHNF